MSDGGNPDLRLIEELATVFSDRNEAIALLTRVRFPASLIPHSTTALAFWTHVVRQTHGGVRKKGMLFHIVEEALRSHGANPVFAEYCSKLGNASASAPEQETPGAESAQPRVQSCMVLTWNYEGMPDTRTLNKILKALQNATGDYTIELTAVHKGSLILVLEMTEPSADRIAALLESGDLSSYLDHEVIRFERVPPDPAPPAAEAPAAVEPPPTSPPQADPLPEAEPPPKASAAEDTDLELLDGWRRGANEAVGLAAGDVLVHRHFSELYGFFGNTVRDEARRMLVQKTFARLVAADDDLHDGSGFRTMLFGVARRVLQDYFASRHEDLDPITQSVEDAGEPPPTQSIELEHRHVRMLQLMRALPIDTKVMLELHYWQRLTTAQVGEIYGIEPSAVRRRLQAARNLLRHLEAGDRRATNRSADLSTSSTDDAEQDDTVAVGLREIGRTMATSTAAL